MRFEPIVLLSALAVGPPSTVLAVDEPTAAVEEQAQAPAESEIEIADSAATVTGALQGKEGLRIQTLCTHCNSANVQVGGLAADLVPIFVNGYPVLSGLATSMILSIMPADTVADAKVDKGPGTAIAPAAAAGGTIRLTGAKPLELPRLDHSAEVGSFDRGRGTMRFSGPLSAWLSGTIVAGRETADPVDDDNDGANDVGALTREFTEASLEFEAGRDHTVDVGFAWIDEENIDGRGGFDFPAFNDPMVDLPLWTREDTLLDRREYRTGWQWKLGKGRSLDVRLLADNRHQTTVSQLTRIDIGDFDELKPRVKIREENESGSVRYRHPVGLRGVIAVGVEAQDEEVFALIEEQFVMDEATDIVETRSGFVDFDTKLGSMFNLQVGVRYEDLEWGALDYRPTIFDPPERRIRSRSRTLPRATIRYRPISGWTFKLIAGSTLRSPRPIFSEVCCGQRYTRNVDTASETGTSVGFEGVYQPSPNLRTSIYAARAEFDDYIVRLVGRSEFYTQTYALGNIDETRAETVEVAVGWTPIPRLTLDASAGWLSHDNEGDEDVPLVLTNPDQIVLVPVDQVPYEPERTGSLAATISLPSEIELSAQASYTGSMLIQQYDEDLFAFPLLLEEMRETPGFWLVNFSFRAPLWKGLELLGGVDNITDRLQNDLDDPTTDYNWGPLAGQSWRLGLRYSQGGP
jgi:outer membrane receptor protein involved in Fe transport